MRNQTGLADMVLPNCFLVDCPGETEVVLKLQTKLPCECKGIIHGCVVHPTSILFFFFFCIKTPPWFSLPRVGAGPSGWWAMCSGSKLRTWISSFRHSHWLPTLVWYKRWQTTPKITLTHPNSNGEWMNLVYWYFNNRLQIRILHKIMRRSQ